MISFPVIMLQLPERNFIVARLQIVNDPSESLGGPKSHLSVVHTSNGNPVRNESRIRNVARVVVARSSREIGAALPSRTTAQTVRTSSRCPLSCSRSLVFFSRPPSYALAVRKSSITNDLPPPKISIRSLGRALSPSAK